MSFVELQKIKEIDNKLAQLKHTYEQFIVVWDQVDRKKTNLENQMRLLEGERKALVQGQMLFQESADF